MQLNGIRFSRNLGKEAVLTAGIEHSNVDSVICIDADLQHPPEVISDFLEKWEHGYEIVIGIRKEEKDFFVLRKIGSKLFYYLIFNE